MQSHRRKVHVCLAVTCHLHRWQNGRDLLGATAVPVLSTMMVSSVMDKRRGMKTGASSSDVDVTAVVSIFTWLSWVLKRG